MRSSPNVIDVAFAAAKKETSQSGPPNTGRRRKSSLSPMITVFPVGIERASPHRSRLLKEVVGNNFLDALPARPIGDKAYTSDCLDRRLAARSSFLADLTPSPGAPDADTTRSPCASRSSPLARATILPLAAALSSGSDSPVKKCKVEVVYDRAMSKQ
jgi:hypothetical protein